MNSIWVLTSKKKLVCVALMILDGAHNPHAIKALLATLQERFADYHKEILFTCIKTKALEDMLDLLGAMP
ncbi:hypothetical protein K8353_43075, partial [Burkholderia contaminans]|nr:hypothetical protein [Burkholderia contaminans]